MPVNIIPLSLLLISGVFTKKIIHSIVICFERLVSYRMCVFMKKSECVDELLAIMTQIEFMGRRVTKQIGACVSANGMEG
jgi:hypothetical protein